MNKERVVEIIGEIIAIIVVFMISFTLINIATSHPYQTNNQVNCYDKNGNIIQGTTCYETIHCSNNTLVKWFNDKKCKEFIK